MRNDTLRGMPVTGECVQADATAITAFTLYDRNGAAYAIGTGTLHVTALTCRYAGTDTIDVFLDLDASSHRDSGELIARFAGSTTAGSIQVCKLEFGESGFPCAPATVPSVLGESAVASNLTLTGYVI